MKTVLLFVAVFFGSLSFSSTYLLEAGKRYEISGNTYECQGFNSTTGKITCRFERSTKDDYDFIPTHYDSNAHGNELKSTFLSACNSCIKSKHYSNDSCRFLECFSSADGKSIEVPFDYFRLLPRECR